MAEKKKVPQVVFLIGPPGAGKATQARLLEEQCGFRHLDTTDIITKLFATCDKNGTLRINDVQYDCREEQARFEQGLLMSPDVIANAMMPEVETAKKEKASIAFSGFPKTVEEAMLAVPRIIELFGRNQLKIVHLAGYRELAEFRKIHDLEEEHKKNSPEVAAVLLAEYAHRTKQALAYLEGQGIPVADIDVAMPVQEIFVSVLAFLEIAIPKPATDA